MSAESDSESFFLLVLFVRGAGCEGAAAASCGRGCSGCVHDGRQYGCGLNSLTVVNDTVFESAKASSCVDGAGGPTYLILGPDNRGVRRTE